MKKLALLYTLLVCTGLFAQSNEVMDIKKMSLHKGPPAITTLDVLNKHFAKTDSIVNAADVDCAFYTTETDSYERHYYNGIIYMVKNKNEAFLYSIDFIKSGVELTAENISLSKETSFIQYIKVYRNPHMSNVNGQKLVSVYLGYDGDDKWQLTFENNKLVSIKYLSDC